MNALAIHQPMQVVEPAYHSIDEIGRMATVFAKSGLFGVKTVEQAAALMLVAQADGLHPATVARDYDIIQGRPAKKSEAMLRDFIRNGGAVKWHALTDVKADATFTHPQGGEVRIDWDMKRAKDAQLGGKDMWKKFPRQMLRSRVISEGIRTVCPMATGGMYVPEEVRDFAPDPVEPKPAARQRIEAQPQPEAEDAAFEEAESGALIMAKGLLQSARTKDEFSEIWNVNKAGWRGVMSDEDYAAIVKVMRDEAKRWTEAKPEPDPQADDGDFGDIDAAAYALDGREA